MTLLFNSTTNHPTPSQRIAALEACIVASLNRTPKNAYEIRRFVLSCKGFEWFLPFQITETFVRMERQRRIERVFIEGFSMPVYRLSEDPMKGFGRFPTTPEAVAERERKILGSIDWPRFFHIPMKEELRPYSKGRTGYDVREDMNLF